MLARMKLRLTFATEIGQLPAEFRVEKGKIVDFLIDATKNVR